MGYGTIRISDSAHSTLRDLAQAEGTSMLALLDEAVETLRRQRFLEQVNAAYAALRGDAAVWDEIEKERATWDATLGDGLAAAQAKAPYGTRSGSTGRSRAGRKG